MAVTGRRVITGENGRNLVGKRVQERRYALNLSQEQLAGRIADLTDGTLSIDYQVVYRIEAGTRLVTDIEAVILAAILEADLNWLLTGERGAVTEAVVRRLLGHKYGGTEGDGRGGA